MYATDYHTYSVQYLPHWCVIIPYNILLDVSGVKWVVVMGTEPKTIIFNTRIPSHLKLTLNGYHKKYYVLTMY